MNLQKRKNLNLGNFIPLWSPRAKWHLGASPMARHRKYYKGEGGGYPQIQAVVSLMSLCFPMARPWIKSALIMH